MGRKGARSLNPTVISFKHFILAVFVLPEVKKNFVCLFVLIGQKVRTKFLW